MSPALNALRLLITIAAARAFYMPPAFDAEAVPGHSAYESDAAQNRTAGSGAPGTSTAAVFDFRNRTEWEREYQYAVGGPEGGVDPAITSPNADTCVDGRRHGHGAMVGVAFKFALMFQSKTSIRVSAHAGRAEHPLAEGFDLTQGHAKVKVPDVSPRTATSSSDGLLTVIIYAAGAMLRTVFGDSGNRSPAFTIMH
ncbi:hypothetical protein C8T65DRAFT_692994 [Cerioporus squamosus]|nr:hypothetical protein C8T65DRAFT_692994 [Cerioporus squamosus]